jgi:hypothetical protein
MSETGGQTGRKRGRKRSAATLVVLAGVLVAAIVIAVYEWRQVGDVEIATGGLVVLVVGIGVTLALGAGLIALMIISNRRRYGESDRD